MLNSLIFRLGALNAGTSIIIQAIGGHNKDWDIDRKLTFSKAFELQITSAIGMMICAHRNKTFISLSPSFLFLAGCFLFSGVAYYRCFKDNKQYNYLMPPGGTCIILGWLLLALL
jgi:uncharacterized membrane protein YgdD (TMEM256/DUF423 family)